MTRYRLSGTVEEAHLSSIIAAYGAAGMRSDLDPEITLSLMSKFNPFAEPPDAEGPGVALTSIKHPRKGPIVKRAAKHMTKGNGGEWPAPGSIYDVVLETIREEPKTPTQLRDILKSRGFSPGSVNSALSRLAKANKAAATGTGTWTATG